MFGTRAHWLVTTGFCVNHLIANWFSLMAGCRGNNPTLSLDLISYYLNLYRTCLYIEFFSFLLNFLEALNWSIFWLLFVWGQVNQASEP